MNCSEKDDHTVKRMGFIAYLTKGLNDKFNENLPSIRHFYGEPIEDFKHFAQNEESDKLNVLVLLLSGLSVPDKRIKVIINRIERVEEELNKTQTSSVLNNALDKLSAYDGTKDAKNDSDDEFDMDSILDKY